MICSNGKAFPKRFKFANQIEEVNPGLHESRNLEFAFEEDTLDEEELGDMEWVSQDDEWYSEDEDRFDYIS